MTRLERLEKGLMGGRTRPKRGVSWMLAMLREAKSQMEAHRCPILDKGNTECGVCDWLAKLREEA